jgi:hypothetical protein
MSHGPHADPADPFQKRAAVAIAVYTAILALTNMLTSQARSEALLSSNHSTNRWSYYQSKSTKQNLVKLERSMLSHLASATDIDAAMAKLDTEIARYETEKTAIRQEAEQLDVEEKQSSHKEHFFEYSATIAELAIVLAGVALLMTSRKTLYASLAVALAAMVLVVFTVTALPHEHAASAQFANNHPPGAPQ